MVFEGLNSDFDTFLMVLCCFSGVFLVPLAFLFWAFWETFFLGLGKANPR